MAETTNNNNTTTPIECSICTSTIGQPRDDGSVEALITLPCTHAFGLRCLAHAIADRGTCPICRDAINTHIVRDLHRIGRSLAGTSATGDVETAETRRRRGMDWEELDRQEAERDAAAFDDEEEEVYERDMPDWSRNDAGVPDPSRRGGVWVSPEGERFRYNIYTGRWEPDEQMPTVASSRPRRRRGRITEPESPPADIGPPPQGQVLVNAETGERYHWDPEAGAYVSANEVTPGPRRFGPRLAAETDRAARPSPRYNTEIRTPRYNTEIREPRIYDRDISPPPSARRYRSPPPASSRRFRSPPPPPRSRRYTSPPPPPHRQRTRDLDAEPEGRQPRYPGNISTTRTERGTEIMEGVRHIGALSLSERRDIAEARNRRHGNSGGRRLGGVDEALEDSEYFRGDRYLR